MAIEKSVGLITVNGVQRFNWLDEWVRLTVNVNVKGECGISNVRTVGSVLVEIPCDAFRCHPGERMSHNLRLEIPI